MTKPLKQTVFVYEFGGTLAQGNIREHSFIPRLELGVGEFWTEVKELAEKPDADEQRSKMGASRASMRGTLMDSTLQYRTRAGELLWRRS